MRRDALVLGDKKCQKCRKTRAVSGERFCPRCRKAVIKAVHRTAIPFTRPALNEQRDRPAVAWRSIDAPEPER